MLRIVFMGTPEFAVPSLQAISDAYDVVAVYTRPDRPAGRGRQVAASPVKQEAVKRGIAVYQPRTLRGSAAADELGALRPDVIVVAAYGLILPQAVLDIPLHGCINVHASLLPKYRGASPIAFALLAGEAETGISIMLMDAGMDTGPILSQRTVAIGESDTTETLEQKLSIVGADLLCETMPEWIAGQITPQPQDNERATLTRLIKKEDGRINWHSSAEQIVRGIRAYTPWPGAYTIWRAQPLKLLAARAHRAPGAPGSVSQRDGAVLIGTGEGSIQVEQLQMAGKRPLNAVEFVRGYRDFVGAELGESQ